MQPMWQIRETIAVAMLAICAYTDIREKNIYIFPLAVSSSGAVIIIILSGMTDGAGNPGETFVRELLLPAVLGSISVSAAYIFKTFVGAGDGYLIAALVVITGIRMCILSVIAAAFAVFVFCVGMMISGRRQYVQTVPFAPFVLAGFLVVLISET